MLQPMELNNLGVLYRSQGKLAQAERAYLRALEVAEAALGPEHSDTASILGNLAELYSRQNALLKAEPLYRRAIAIQTKAAGPHHHKVAVLLSGHGDLWRRLGDGGRALSLFRKAERALPAGHAHLAVIYRNMAAVHAWEGDLAAAERMLQRALAVRLQAQPNDEAALAQERADLARVRDRLSRASAGAFSAVRR